MDLFGICICPDHIRGYIAAVESWPHMITALRWCKDRYMSPKHTHTGDCCAKHEKV